MRFYIWTYNLIWYGFWPQKFLRTVLVKSLQIYSICHWTSKNSLRSRLNHEQFNVSLICLISWEKKRIKISGALPKMNICDHYILRIKDLTYNFDTAIFINLGPFTLTETECFDVHQRSVVVKASLNLLQINLLGSFTLTESHFQIEKLSLSIWIHNWKW